MIDVSHNYLKRVEAQRREADKRHRRRTRLKVCAGLGITQGEYRRAVDQGIVDRWHRLRGQ